MSIGEDQKLKEESKVEKGKVREGLE